MGNEKSKTDAPIPEWLTGLGSETPEQQSAFRSWLESSPDDRPMESIKQSWLSIIRGDRKEAH